ncbi:uncharacterized protein CDAR_616191 [Caerostris darwini]|uniref:Uncharacterized protein n=1 Tax=Caerostris darwini TaxID=1538125 RepID=A0AAV4PU40_9ARAC|nr:uncharacterized protein CDAR_616191 [Caerostris darwini]
MKISWNTFLVMTTLLVCQCSAFWHTKEDDESDKPSLFKPKLISVFSKPAPDADKNPTLGILPHLGNLLHGGTIGLKLETRPLGLLHDILGHAKKIIPGTLDTIGHPNHEKPPKDLWEQDDEWESEKPKKEENKKWEQQKKPEGPSWEDIGEEPETYNTEVPIEDIIQPRNRPKRFIESKIYHVPLLYRSNGRPYQVKIRSRNDLDEMKEDI